MKKPTKIFVTGGHGNLGKKLIDLLSPTYEVIAPTQDECDILDLNGLKFTIKKHNPDILIHLAAFVDTLGCEKDIESADGVAISVDGGEEATDAMRGKGAFKRAFEAAEICVKAGMQTRIHAVINQHSFRDMDVLAKMCLQKSTFFLIRCSLTRQLTLLPCPARVLF